MTFEWVTTWWAHFGAPNQLYTLILQDGDRVAGVAPLAFYRLAGVGNVVGFVGRRGADYLDLLVEDHRRAEGIGAVLDFLLDRRSDWTLIDLNDIPLDACGVAQRKKALEERGLAFALRPGLSCPYLTIESSWEEYLSGRSRKLRQHAHRSLERLKSEQGAQMEHCLHAAELPPFLQEARTLHQARWRKRYTSSRFSNNGAYEFYADVARRFAERGWLRLSLLRGRRGPIAFSYSFQFQNTSHYFIPGFDPLYAPYSPGTCLLYLLLEDAFRQGLGEFDFMKGDEAYKDRWCSGRRQNYRLIVARREARSILALRSYAAGLTLRGRLRRSPIARRVRRDILGHTRHWWKTRVGTSRS